MSENEQQQAEQAVQANQAPEIEDDPIEVRKGKREALMAAGVDPYGHAVQVSDHVTELNERYANLEDGQNTEDRVLLAGRLMSRRDQGKILFGELRDAARRNKVVEILVASCSCTYEHETPAQAEVRAEQYRKMLEAGRELQEFRAQHEKPEDKGEDSGFKLV